MMVRDHPWTTAAAFVFDLIQVCLSVAGVVGSSVALSSRPDRIEALWLDAVITCYLQLLVGNYVRSQRPHIPITEQRAVYSPVAAIPVLALGFARLVHDDHVVHAVHAVHVLDRVYCQVRLLYADLTSC